MRCRLLLDVALGSESDSGALKENAHQKEITAEDIAQAQRTHRKQQFSASSFDRTVNVMSESFGAENGEWRGEETMVPAPFAVNYEVRSKATTALSLR